MKKIKEGIVQFCRFLKILYIKMKDLKKKEWRDFQIVRHDSNKIKNPIVSQVSSTITLQGLKIGLSNKNYTFQNSKFMIRYFHFNVSTIVSSVSRINSVDFSNNRNHLFHFNTQARLPKSNSLKKNETRVRET